MAEVLEKTGLVERSGQGIDKIFSYTLSEGKPEPDYTSSDAFQVTLSLGGTITDKAFHIFLSQVQSARTEEHKLNVEQIIALHKVKHGAYNQIKPGILTFLEQQGLIKKAGGNSLRYTLASSYERLATIDSA